MKDTLKRLIPAEVKNIINSVRNRNKSIYEGPTKKPTYSSSVISDLFPYRIDENWQTSFELLNLPFLIDPSHNHDHEYKVLFKFFDLDGREVGEHELVNKGYSRKTINITKILQDMGIEGNGTFACFHQLNPEWLKAGNGFLAERGYLGISNNDFSSTKGFVHGNLDAVALSPNGHVECLGAYHGKADREYNLQFELTGKAQYEFAIVNTSAKTQKVSVSFTHQQNYNQSFSVPSKGIKWFRANLESGQKDKLKLKSRLYLARPVVLRIASQSFDVFHG